MIDKVALSIVIALLCLFILFKFGSQIYEVFTKSNKIEQAQGKLDEISRKIDFMESNNKNYDDSIILTAPKDWYLIYFENSDELCICEELRSDDKEQYDICKSVAGKTGVCKKFDEDIEIDDFVTVSGEGRYVQRRNAIKIELTSLAIKRENGIYHFDNSGKDINLGSDLRAFLDSKVDINNVDEKLKDKGIKQGDNFEDIIRLTCFDNSAAVVEYQDTFEHHVEIFFKNKITTNEYIKLGFNNQFSDSVPYWEKGLSLSHELVVKYPKSLSEKTYLSKTYEKIQSEQGDYCLIYFYSTESKT